MEMQQQKMANKKEVLFKDPGVKSENVVFDQESGKYIEILHPKGWERLWFKRQLDALNAHADMLAVVTMAGRNTDRYSQFREIWRKKTDSVEEAEGRVSPRIVMEWIEKGATKDKEGVQNAYNQIGEEIKQLKVARIVETEEEKLLNQIVPVPALPKDAWRGIWDVGTGGKVPETVTDAKLRSYVESVGRSQGKNTLAYAYAESLLKNRQEKPAREEAQQHYDAVKEAEVKLAQDGRDLNEARQRGQGVLEEPNDRVVRQAEKKIEQDQVKIKEAKKEATWGNKFKDNVVGFFKKFKREAKKTPVAEEYKDLNDSGWIPMESSASKKEEKAAPDKEKRGAKESRIQELKDELGRLEKEKWEKIKQVGVIEQGQIEEEYRKKKAETQKQIKELEGEKEGRLGERHPVLGWFAERAKGMATIGWWEVHQAEKFRKGTKDTGKETGAQSQLLEVEKAPLEGRGGEERKERDWEEASRDLVIYQEAVAKNKVIEDEIVAVALQKLEDRLKNNSRVQEYLTQTGKPVITPEKMKLVEERIRGELKKIREGQMSADAANFVKLYRRSFDKYYWSRYIYGGLEAAAWGAALFKWVYPWIMSKFAAGKVAVGAAGAEGIKEGSKYAEQTGLKDTIWGEARRMWQHAGVPNPTDTQIQDVTEAVSKSSGVKVVKDTGEMLWPGTAGGTAKDIALRKDFPLILTKGWEIIQQALGK